MFWCIVYCRKSIHSYPLLFVLVELFKVCRLYKRKWISDLRPTINQRQDLFCKRLHNLNFLWDYILRILFKIFLEMFREGHVFRMWYRKLLTTELTKIGNKIKQNKKGKMIKRNISCSYAVFSHTMSSVHNSVLKE